jgi:hypothetical protein
MSLVLAQSNANDLWSTIVFVLFGIVVMYLVIRGIRR